MASRSYAWSLKLPHLVGVDDNIDVPTPGFDHPERYDTANAEVVYGNQVLQPAEVSLEWADEFDSVNVTNLTDENWQPSETIYVTVKLSAPEAGEGGGSEEIAALEARVAQNETDIAALQEGFTDLEARVVALETPAKGASKR